MIKIEIYSPDIHRAARLAGAMNLHLSQWEYVGSDPKFPGVAWANCEPLFERIKWLEDQREGN